MYSHFSISNQLPSIDNALNFQKCLIAGNYIMLISLITILLCIAMTFVFDHHFSIHAQVFGHIATIIFAGLLKIGYVVRCIALHAFGRKDF